MSTSIRPGRASTGRPDGPAWSPGSPLAQLPLSESSRSALRWMVVYLLPPLLVLPAAWAPSGSTQPDLRPLGAGLLVAAAMVVVTGRRRYPRSTAAAAIVLSLVTLALTGPFVAVLTALMIVAYSTGRHTDRRTTVVVAVTAAVLVGTASALLVPAEWGAVRSLVQVVALVGFAAAVGDAARSRAAFIEAIQERVRRAEEGKESEARSRVAEERLRIARDLHDVMAHQIAVINLHAGVASQALPTRPADAERSLSTIREASRTVLSEIASLLRVLRASDPALAGGVPDVTPVPGLGQLDRLVADFEAVGLSVDLRMVGQPVELPQAVDMVAYRVIHEALTNAHKHGDDSSALLQLEYSPGLLDVTVTNTVAKSAPGGHLGGHGLMGARERLASVDGELTTSFGPGPVHRLTVRLPLTEAAAVDAGADEKSGPADAAGADR